MKKIMAILLICFTILISGCNQTIEEIKTTENIGEKVSVNGEVLGSIKILKLSGYTIQDENGDTIAVTAENLPETGETITAKGTLMKDLIFGYYIKSKE